MSSFTDILQSPPGYVIAFIFGIILTKFFGGIGSELSKQLVNRGIARLSSTEKKRNNEDIIAKLDEKEEQLNKAQEEVSQYQYLMDKLKDENFPTEKVVNNYWRSLPAVILTLTNKETPSDFDPPEDYDGEPDEFNFVKWIAQNQYNAKLISTSTYVIPPSDFPEELDQRSNRKKLQEWIDSAFYEKYPDHKAHLNQVSVVDIKNVYSRSDYDKADREWFMKTIDDELNIKDLLRGEDISTILAKENLDLSEIISGGDIAFLSSGHLNQDQWMNLRQNQQSIEDNLGNPSLREIAVSDGFQSELEKELQNYINEPSELSENIVQEAQEWYEYIHKEPN